MLLSGIINDILKFITSNSINILIVIIIFLFILILFSILGISLNKGDIKNSSKKINKIITIEGMEDNNKNNKQSKNIFASGLFKKHENDPEKIHNICATLSNKNCKITSSCGILNNQGCVGGNKHGPTYHPKKIISWVYN